MGTVIYCRVSTEEQQSDDSYSLPNQENRCLSYLKSKESKIKDVEVVKEVGSGKDLKKRPKFRKILKDIEKGNIDTIVVYKLDRLSRSTRDIYDFLDLVKAKNVSFISITESFDTSTAMGRAMLGVAAVFSQLTRETISENVKDGLNQRKRQGLVPTGAPYGYQNVKDEKGIKTIVPSTKPRIINGEVIVDKVPHPEVVKMIYDFYLNKGYGLSRIATILNNMKIPTCYYPKTQMWNRQSILCILDSSIYTSLVRINGKLSEASHEAIIDRATWEAVQQKRKERRTISTSMQASNNLLSGIARCMKCNRAMVVHRENDKARTKKLRCVGNSKIGDKACRGIDVKTSVLEDIVLSEIKKVAESDTFQKRTVKEAKNLLHVNGAIGRQERKSQIVSELADIENQMERWSTAYTKGILPIEQFERYNSKLVKDQTKLSEELNTIEAEIQNNELANVNVDTVIKAIKNFPRLWSKMDIGEQKEFLRLVVHHLSVARHECRLELIIGDEMSFSY